MSDTVKTEPAVTVNIAEVKEALAAGRVPEPWAKDWTEMFKSIDRFKKVMVGRGPVPTPEVAAQIAEAEEKYGKVFNQVLESDEECAELEAMLDGLGLSHSRTAVEYDAEEWEMELMERQEA